MWRLKPRYHHKLILLLFAYTLLAQIVSRNVKFYFSTIYFKSETYLKVAYLIVNAEKINKRHLLNYYTNHCTYIIFRKFTH